MKRPCLAPPSKIATGGPRRSRPRPDCPNPDYQNPDVIASRSGEERVVKRVDRRTFLGNSLRTGVVAAPAGSVGLEEWAVPQPSSSATPSLRGRPLALSTNGDSSPVGVDPDDTSFG